MEPKKIDPQALLKLVEDQQQNEKSAKLRLFLGMSAGVGKTYSMLKAAKKKKMEGFDVVIGLVETHGRVETAELITDFEIIPRKKITYRGTDLEEMDIDAILNRQPQIVIVDELAHSNVPGSRHEKRYQDVLELLNSGIDVFTALNVQHLESRKESVEAIAQIQIRETVPDSLLERAHLVELVDIAPSELLKRLAEGKIYLGDKAKQAALGFFKEDKLTALREIALRLTAEKVDHDLQKFRINSENQLWITHEKLMVAISHSPFSERLIRATRRLAYNLEAPWIAVHVDTGQQLSDADQAQLVKNLTLARELKAEVITTTDIDISSALSRISLQKNITQIIVGRPTKHPLLDFFQGGSLLKKLLIENKKSDIHILGLESEVSPQKGIMAELSQYRTHTGLKKYWNTLWLLIAMTGLGILLEPLIGYRTVGFIFLLGIVGIGMLSSLSVVLYAALLSSLIWNFGFIPPRFTFVIAQPEDMILCLVYFIVASIIGYLAHRIRSHEKLIRDREQRTSVLYETLQDISLSQNKNEFIEKISERLGRLLQGESGVILKNKTEFTLNFSDKKNYEISLNEKEQAVALWTFQNKKSAGWSTDTLGQTPALFIPMMGVNELVGVFVFKPTKLNRKLGPDQENLLYSIVSQLSVAIERHFLSHRLHEAKRLEDSENLHQTLLNSISHEIRTPLTAILSGTAALETEALKNPSIKEIALDLNDAGLRLNRVIENLLDMSRLNSGVLALKMEWQDLSDVLGVVLKKLEKVLVGNKLEIDVDPNLGLLKADFRLLEHALSNLILNAHQYAGPYSTIKIYAQKNKNILKITIADSGPGIPPEHAENIFEKFFRLPGSPTGGTGLGLSIVKGIIELHHGKIQLDANASPGACFIITLPLENQPTLPHEKI